ncbi:transketolase C-terminal domain-containing protein [Microcoleus vaginatus]|uniref:transketolase C-terminal domain-containing protein n=1 Tax=Microcoleus vaginatus TaxID=119532 RepID=UPI001688A828|nr:transketolase [Microcoleus sp. FACHB-84]MBD2009646.1 transketolase [Microcoleus sp. FACHB-45]
MRQLCLDTVYELAKKDRRIFFIGSDLGFGTLQKFKEEMPERFLMEGVNEANIVGMAAGLALEGKIVYVNTIATFLSRRCFEQIVLDLCLHNVNVRLIANGGGVVYAPLGPTHLAIDDIGILRTIPRMTIVAPADEAEMGRLMPETVDYRGPIYIRLGKGNEPILTTDEIPFQIGKAIPMREGTDALIITTGVTLKAALDAAANLSKQGLEAAVLHVHTVKPLDSDAILKYAADVPVIVTIEEHTLMGGLGSAVAELVAEANFNPAKRFKRIGIPDVFPEQYGSQESLMALYGLTAEKLAAAVATLAERRREPLAAV